MMWIVGVVLSCAVGFCVCLGLVVWAFCAAAQKVVDWALRGL